MTCIIALVSSMKPTSRFFFLYFIIFNPFTVTSSTDKVDTRARGRLVSLKIENDAAGETWRYGTLRLDAQPDGRR